jgi:hypothetical protein
VVQTATDYTMTINDDLVIGTSTSEIFITLPDVAARNKAYYFQNFGTGFMTIQTVSSQLINSDTKLTLQFKNSSVKLISIGTKFLIF